MYCNRNDTMTMVCPKCSGSFEQSLNCPTCGVRLLYKSRGWRRTSTVPGEPGNRPLAPIGRIFAAILLAQGLAYSLQLLCNAYLQMATIDAQQSIWSTLYGLVLLQSIQGVSLLAGGGLAGAAQRRAAALGAIVGAAHSSIFLVVLRLQGEQVTEVAMYGQPVLHVAFGVLGAVIGARIWPPLPTVAMPDADAEMPAPSRRRSLTLAALQGPVAWGRVFAGMVIVTGGFLWAPSLLTVVLDAGQGTLRINDRLQAQLVTWEIIGLATLIGAAVAGATTRNGLKHGLCVGAGTSILLIGNYLGARSVPLSQMAYTTASILALTIAGGWFGGQLFPPVVRLVRHRTIGSPY
jgi:DNA-directed RNA polymerase subunit RPC12/RpoP